VNELVIGLFGGGSIISILGVLTTASLKVQKQLGQQIAEWRAIVDEKDKQILRLEATLIAKESRITHLETRVSELERQVQNG
jgi:uncharacterized protein (DUF3084 family)